MKKYTNIFLISVIVIVAGSCRSSVRQGFHTEAENIDSVLEKMGKGGRPMRIALLDFTDSTGKVTSFSQGVNYEVESRLSKSGKFRIMERRNLNLLLKEQTFSQSGLISSGDAVKIGSLLPVDLIVTGSYFSERRGVIVNGRFISVTDGEITETFSFLMEGKNDEVFEGENDSDKNACPVPDGRILKVLQDLRSDQSRNAALEAVLKVPYTSPCEHLHFKTMDAFIQVRFFPESYSRFLGKHLAEIHETRYSKRKGEAIRFFKSDGIVDQNEWIYGLKALEYAEWAPLKRYVSGLLNYEHVEDVQVRFRIGELFILSKKNKIGNPVPFQEKDLFFILLESMTDIPLNHTGRFIRYLITEESGRPGISEQAVGKYALYITHVFKNNDADAANTPGLDEVLKYMEPSLARIESMPPGDNRSYMDGKLWVLFNVISRINRKEKIFRREDYERYIKATGPTVCRIVKKGDRSTAEFAVINQYSCEGLADINELIHILDDRQDNWEKKIAAVKLLLKMEKGAWKAEGILREYMGVRGADPKAIPVKCSAIRIMGILETENTDSVDLIIQMLGDRRCKHEADIAIRKLPVKIVVDRSIIFLKKNTHAGNSEKQLLVQVMNILRYFGKSARPSLPVLKSYAGHKDTYLRNHAVKTINEIETAL